MRGVPALGVLALAGLLAGCGSTPTGVPSTSTSTTGGDTSTTTTPAAAGWAPAGRISSTKVVSLACPTVSFCMALDAAGQAYRRVGSTWSPATPALSGGLTGVSAPGSLSCPTTTFCMAVAAPDQSARWTGAGWSPLTVPSAQGVAAVSCASPSYCATIDGLGFAFAYGGSGWSGTSGAWGAANDISCVSPNFCAAVEGGPTVWDGGSWTQPSGADTAGQLDAVSCTSPTYCLAVDTAGDAFTYNGSAWVGPTKVEASPEGSAFGGPSGLSAVSCAAPTACTAVGSNGDAYRLTAAGWSAAAPVDPGEALTSVACATAAFCLAGDARGKVFEYQS